MAHIELPIFIRWHNNRDVDETPLREAPRLDLDRGVEDAEDGLDVLAEHPVHLQVMCHSKGYRLI
ncbi:MAG: hypothetical protein IIB88_05445 [Chloroflexi bacterium]|nr:hypothetical protein [Chloroflexota bacterium]